MEKRVVRTMDERRLIPRCLSSFPLLSWTGAWEQGKGSDVPAGDIAEHSVIVERVTDVIILA